MNDDKGIAFLSRMISSSYGSGSDSDSEREADCLNSVAKFSGIEFQVPIEVVVTLEQISAVIHKVANIPFRIGLDVYGKGFLQSSRVYIRDARSLFEMMEIFTITAGLNWRFSEDGAVEIYRDKMNNLKLIKSSGQTCVSTCLN